MNLLNYFDLDLQVEEATDQPTDKTDAEQGEPVLGLKDQATVASRLRRKSAARKRLWLTLAMYVGLFIGVLSENLLAIIKMNQPLTLATFGVERILVAILIATTVFPLVFPQIFGSESKLPRSIMLDRRVLQFCVAFQNGFFWQSVLKHIL